MPASMDSPSPKSLGSESKAESADKDLISSLPEDVIEAQATCLLSRRWRHLSTCQVTNLDFDWSDSLAETRDNPELAENKRARYVEWVDNVLHSQSRGYRLRRFALRFDLSISHQSHIDWWIRFALAKGVKILQLNFEAATSEDYRPDCDPSRLPYVLRQETLMDADVGCSQWASCLSNFGLRPSSSWHVAFRYLEELTLNRVTVDGELIEQLLANCLVLERLILEFVRTSHTLRVIGRSLKLKYLVITCCDGLQRVEVYDTDLVSFAFVGTEFQLCLDKLPQLSEMSISGFWLPFLHVTLSELSSLSCLQILKLECLHIPYENLLLRQLPRFTSVKHLELGIRGYGDASLLPLTLVLEACPCLQTFMFKLMYAWKMLCRQRELKRVVGHPHQYLKEVEFDNYYGRPCDHEFVNYLVENAIALEKLVVNPCDEEDFGTKRVKEPRERALQQLKGKLPSRIELVIN